MYTPYVGPVGLEVMIGGLKVVGELVCGGVFLMAAAEVVDAAEFVAEIVESVSPIVDVTSSTVTCPFTVVVADLMHISWDLTVQHVCGAEDGVDNEIEFGDDEVVVLLWLVENFVLITVVPGDRDCADDGSIVPNSLE